jgi:uncharacterized protein YjbJ (UPF0337 family)
MVLDDNAGVRELFGLVAGDDGRKAEGSAAAIAAQARQPRYNTVAKKVTP